MPNFDKIGSAVGDAASKIGSADSSVVPDAVKDKAGELGGKAGMAGMEKMGMGDIASSISDVDAKAMEDRLRNGEMTFDDFLMQVKVMQKGASMQAMLGKMGGGQFSQDQIAEGQKKMERYGKFVEAMDLEEREDTSLLRDETAAAR